MSATAPASLPDTAARRAFGLGAAAVLLLRAAALPTAWAEAGGLSGRFWLLVTLAALAAAGGLAAAGVVAGRAQPATRGARVADLLWALAVAAAAASWPAGVSPASHPFASALLAVVLAASPAAAAGLRDGHEPAVLARYRRAVVWGFLVAALVVAARFLLKLRPAIEGVDFYYYVCYARDLAAGAPDISLAIYAYFPGIYRFWHLAFAVGDGSLGSLQVAYLLVLAANTVLTGALIGRAGGGAAPAVCGALWYLCAACSLEAPTGNSEPIATLPVLAGLLVWGGRSLRGRSGLLRAAGLGAGLGLGVLVKQQGALPGLGALTILVAALAGPKDERPGRLPLLVASLAALGVFLAGILAEGQGLVPLALAFELARIYRPVGTVGENLLDFARAVPALAAGTVLAAAGWIAIAISKPGAWASPVSLAVARFTWLGGVAALLQFTRRPYLHYGMLAAPFLVVAVVLGGVQGAKWLVRAAPSRPLARFALPILGLLALTRTPGGSGKLHLWPLQWDPFITWPEALRRDPAFVRDLDQARGLVRPGDDMLLLPPRRNEVHFHLGTRSVSMPLGYGWPVVPEHLVTALKSPQVRTAVVLENGDAIDNQVWRWAAGDAIVAALPGNGFTRVLDLETLDVWQRGPAR